jgi:hypothetical protein
LASCSPSPNSAHAELLERRVGVGDAKQSSRRRAASRKHGHEHGRLLPLLQRASRLPLPSWSPNSSCSNAATLPGDALRTQRHASSLLLGAVGTPTARRDAAKLVQNHAQHGGRFESVARIDRHATPDFHCFSCFTDLW